MVVLPMLKGGRIENRWQPMSQETWCWPELPLDELHGGEDRPFRAAGAEGGRAPVDLAADAGERVLDPIVAGRAALRSGSMSAR